MRYSNQSETLIEVSAQEGAHLGAPQGGFFPVALFTARGGNLDDVEPWRPFAGDVAAAKAAKNAALNAVAAARIVAGFTSSALGAPHVYPSNETDQQNLTAQVVASMLPNLPGNWTTLQICGDENGVWTYRPHTVAQIQQVGLDGKTRIQALLVHNAVRKAEVGALNDIGAVVAYDVESGWPA